MSATRIFRQLSVGDHIKIEYSNIENGYVTDSGKVVKIDNGGVAANTMVVETNEQIYETEQNGSHPNEKIIRLAERQGRGIVIEQKVADRTWVNVGEFNENSNIYLR